jgi:hypothetical protein
VLVRHVAIVRFNGGLFESIEALPVNRKQFDILCLAAAAKRIVCGPANRASQNAVKQPSRKAKPDDVFGQRQKVETAAGRRGDLADAKFL